MTLTEQLAATLRARPNVWIDGLDIARVAGSYAWRSRLSDLRRAPYYLTIENRVRTVRTMGRTYKVSEYRLVQPQEAHV